MPAYLVNWIKAYEAEGIKINFIVPQNEPGWAQAYPSCAWGSYYDGSTTHYGTTYLGDFVKNNLSPAMKTASLTTNIWYGTFSNDGRVSGLLGEHCPSDKTLVKGVALQWATDVQVCEGRCGWLQGDAVGTQVRQLSVADAKATSEADVDPRQLPSGPRAQQSRLRRGKLGSDQELDRQGRQQLQRLEHGARQGRLQPRQVSSVAAKRADCRRWHDGQVHRGLLRVPARGGVRGAGRYRAQASLGGNALAFKNPDGTVVDHHVQLG